MGSCPYFDNKRSDTMPVRGTRTLPLARREAVTWRCSSGQEARAVHGTRTLPPVQREAVTWRCSSGQDTTTVHGFQRQSGLLVAVCTTKSLPTQGRKAARKRRSNEHVTTVGVKTLNGPANIGNNILSYLRLPCATPGSMMWVFFRYVDFAEKSYFLVGASTNRVVSCLLHSVCSGTERFFPLFTYTNRSFLQ